MNIIRAAEETLEHFSKIGNNLSETHPWYGKLHIYEMLEAIIEEKVIDEKAHRYLGWAQCAMCIGDAVTLDELLQINRNA